MTLLDQLLDLLSSEGIDFVHIQHEPATSTRHIAQLRGMTPADGCKGLLMKAGKQMVLVALPADRSLDNRALRKVLGVSRLRFATRGELAELTGLVPGQVPPWGEPLLPFPVVADQSILDRERIAFTCGTHTDSIIVGTSDWCRLAAPRLDAFTSRS